MIPAGTLRADGYYVVHVKGKPCYRHRAVWEAVHGAIPKGMYIDHINGVRGDDRIENLQLVTNADNSRLGSYCLKPRNTTGYNCVHLNHCGRWYGLFRLNGKRVYCGTHSTAEEAHAAVLAKRKELNAPTRRVATHSQEPSSRANDPHIS